MNREDVQKLKEAVKGNLEFLDKKSMAVSHLRQLAFVVFYSNIPHHFGVLNLATKIKLVAKCKSHFLCGKFE